MPELPDLTVFAANLDARLKGCTVKTVTYHKNKRLNVPAAALQHALCGSRVEEIFRSGKEVAFRFSNGAAMTVHLMLSGEFSIGKQGAKADFDILTIEFENGESLIVSDPKSLVTVTLDPAPSNVPDALEVTSSYLKARIREKPRTLVKGFLIDQGILRGIGNAYADEILWKARISPKSIAGKLPDEAIEELARCTKAVLLEAIDQIKAAKPDTIAGEVRDFLAVHNPRRSKSPTGHRIVKEQVASKTTYYTDEQTLYA